MFAGGGKDSLAPPLFSRSLARKNSLWTRRGGLCVVFVGGHGASSGSFGGVRMRGLFSNEDFGAVAFTELKVYLPLPVYPFVFALFNSFADFSRIFYYM